MCLITSFCGFFMFFLLLLLQMIITKVLFSNFVLLCGILSALFFFFFCSDPSMDDEAPTDGSFASRFSASRLHSIGHQLLKDQPAKWAVINGGSF